MIVLVQANILTVGLDNKNEVLRELPIRVITKQSGFEAARSLKTEKVDSVISKWDLEDMRDGRFLKGLRAVKPNIPTIALIRSGDQVQEISARSLGISAVLSEEGDDRFFLETVINVLGLCGVVSRKTLSSAQ